MIRLQISRRRTCVVYVHLPTVSPITDQNPRSRIYSRDQSSFFLFYPGGCDSICPWASHNNYNYTHPSVCEETPHPAWGYCRSPTTITCRKESKSRMPPQVPPFLAQLLRSQQHRVSPPLFVTSPNLSHPQTHPVGVQTSHHTAWFVTHP